MSPVYQLPLIWDIDQLIEIPSYLYKLPLISVIVCFMSHCCYFVCMLIDCYVFFFLWITTFIFSVDQNGLQSECYICKKIYLALHFVPIVQISSVKTAVKST